MLAFITAILALPGAISALISQIGNLISAMEKAQSAQNIQQSNQISNVEVPAIKTTEDAQKVAKDIQDLVGKS